MKSFEFNLAQLKAIAQGLGDLLPRVTFVGGCTTALLVDKAAYSGVRQTEDVDVIIDVATYLKFQDFSKELRKRGFREDVDGPICRWLFMDNNTTIKLDVMPVDERVLHFSNRWYPGAIRHSIDYSLDENLAVRVVSPVYFLATKFEAFLGRGEGNYFSHDLEDIVFVLENRSDFIRELLDASPELKAYFSIQAKSLLNDKFLNVLPGLLNNEQSFNQVVNALKIMASWG